MISWFFPRRSAAIAIVEIGFPDIRTALATELIEMIVWGSKNLNPIFKSKLDTIDQILIAADGITRNKTAHSVLSSKLKLDEKEIYRVCEYLKFSIDEYAMLNHRVEFARIRSLADQIEGKQE